MRWRELNDQSRKAKDVKVILRLHKAEQKGKARKEVAFRYSYLRRNKEMKAVASPELFL